MTQEPLPENQETTEAPAPTEAPPVPESLAEQVYREAHTVPESTTPSDVVPNRPNIRAPGTEEIVEPEPEVEAEAEAEPEHESAKELIAEAEAAETTESLDEIEGRAEGRVTVLNAVMERRSQLRGR